MCSNGNSLPPGSLLPFGLKLGCPTAVGGQGGGLLTPAGPSFAAPGSSAGMSPAASLELHRAQAQLFDYNARLRFGLQYAAAAAAAASHHPGGLGPFGGGGPHGGAPHPADPMAAYLYGRGAAPHLADPRLRYLHEEPKPSHSYIGLIAMAILNSKERKLVLSDIYQWILDNYPYFRTRGPGWRNSIRHNLSLNDCFIKAGRSANGKGHYWAIHPANVDDFTKGDFRRRRAQRKVRKAMGLAVPDEEDSPSPPPAGPGGLQPGSHLDWGNRLLLQHTSPSSPPPAVAREEPLSSPGSEGARDGGEDGVKTGPPAPSGHRKRLFDVESLLAPDMPPPIKLRIMPPVPLLIPDAASQGQAKDEDDDDDKGSVVDVEVDDEEDDKKNEVEHKSESLAQVAQQSPGAKSVSRSPSPCSAPASPVKEGSASPASAHEGPTPAGPLHRLGLPHPHPAMWAAAWAQHQQHDRPNSAFHTLPGALPAWGALHPHGYPLLAPAVSSPSEPVAHKWQLEAFSRLMSRAQDAGSRPMGTSASKLDC